MDYSFTDAESFSAFLNAAGKEELAGLIRYFCEQADEAEILKLKVLPTSFGKDTIRKRFISGAA
jgi:hypothetical protein